MGGRTIATRFGVLGAMSRRHRTSRHDGVQKERMGMPAPLLKLLVLKTPQVDRMLAFYRTLGIELNEEKHGTGPVHYAGKVGDTVLEIYPLPPGSTSDATTRLGFIVASLTAVVDAFREFGLVLTEPKMSTWGVRAVVRDPDGRAVEIYEAQPNQEV
jgi:lactoylglutathione lyase